MFTFLILRFPKAIALLLEQELVLQHLAL